MPRRSKRVRLSVLATTVVVLGGAGTTYAVAGAEDTPRYRTVAATTADVEQTLSSSGVVDAAHRADLGFGTDGTIAKLKVALGDTVKAGQVVAVLDTTDLDAAVTDAKASVAQAVAQLASDRAAQSSSVQQASNPTLPSKPSGSGQGSGDSAATAALLKQLKGLQDAVIAAQSAASQALAAAKAALATQVDVCAAANTAAASTDGETADDPTGDACSVALAAVQDRQQDVSDAQDALAGALDGLAGVLTKALGSLSSAGNQPTSNARTAASSPSSQASSPSGGATITAARLASDQAQIEQARADLVSAQQERAQAALRSTRSGRVVALDVGKGDLVSAGDTVATVIGGKAVTVTGTVSESRLDQLEVGQTVRVTVPGATKAAAGTVTAIGLVADTSSGTTSYPFTVTIEDPTISLPTGSRALLQVVLSTAKDVVTVPTSAVTRNGATAIVRTWDGSTLSRKTVTIGAVGTRSVQITRGLEAGDEVVLAAIDDPIKGAQSELDDRGGFGGPARIEFRAPGGGGGPVTFSSGK